MMVKRVRMKAIVSAKIILFSLWTVVTALTVLYTRAQTPPASVSSARESDLVESAFRLVREAVEKSEVPGAIVLVARGGRILRQEAFGRSDLENEIPFA